MTTTPQRTPNANINIRYSLYTERIRTPVRLRSTPGTNAVTPQDTGDIAPNQVTPSNAVTPQDTGDIAPNQVTPSNAHRFQLHVRPIVKTTVGQRDSSGKMLADYVANGSTFADIVTDLWKRFGSRVNSRAVRGEDEWISVAPCVADWTKVMQLKAKKHIVDTMKSETAMNHWLVKTRGNTIILVIFEYGSAISTQQQLEEFKAACIRQQNTDRAGAIAEQSLRDVVIQLQAQWSTTFTTDSVVWRMWATHVTRSTNRHEWENAINLPPPNYIVHLLRPSDSRLEEQHATLTRSSHMALDCIKAPWLIATDCDVIGRHLDTGSRHLKRIS
ncbi:hypothetical protein AC1031_003666 [Aphanomyces cochlioides]|nr:hypothetical protein AC1031_003666 [Aphanomyces cochlioides]